MKLTSKSFKDSLTALESAYLNWKLPMESITTWKNTIALAISDELYPVVILDWITHMTTPPKNPAELIKHASEMIRSDYGSADSEAELLIESGRNAYYSTDDFLFFADQYENSFAALLGTPVQEAYILNNIQKHSSSPNILIMVFDEYKGTLKDCFRGDAESGIEFLRNNIKKSWNIKTTEATKIFLKSGNTEFKRINSTVTRRLEDPTNE